MNFISVIIFKICLDITYIEFVSKVFSYDGFFLIINELKIIESWFAFILIYYVLLKKSNHVLYFSFQLIFLVLITPMTTLYAYRDENVFSFIIIMLAFLIVISMLSNKRIVIKPIKNGRIIILIISLFACALVLLNYLVTTGISNINFDLTKVYELRAEFDSQVNSGIFGYLNNWVIKVFNVFLISWSLLYRRKSLLLFFIFFQILLFGLSGHKLVLITTFLILGLYFLFKFKNYTFIMINALSFMVLLLFVFYLMTDDVLLPSILIRRAFFVPSHLNYTYFEFFSSNEFIYWSNSVLKMFLQYPYDLTATHVIGNYLGHPEMGANTGFIASGYMHMGVVGVFLYTIIFIPIINSVNSFKYLKSWFLNAVFLIPLMTSFISSDLLTSMLTHGIFISIVVLYFYNSNSINLKFKGYRFEI